MFPSKNRVVAWVSAMLVVMGCAGDDVTAPTTGSIEVSAATTGTEMDADGYAAVIDGGEEAALGSNASLQRSNLDVGSHSVLLTGLASNCSVAGENPRTVSVVAAEMTTVSFAVTCIATTGSLRVTVATGGTALDPDGYTLSLDGADRGPIPSNGAASLDELATGSHTVGLSGISAHCQVDGDNPRPATVTAGASSTVAFVITCADPAPAVGSLRIITLTAGVNPDPDGYAFALDGGASQPIGVNATVNLPNMVAGAHVVALSGLAANCTVGGANPQSISVASSATAEVTFEVTCSAVFELKIAFTKDQDDSPEGFGPERVFLLNANGTTRQLSGADDYTDYYDLKWSPDGRRIAAAGYHVTGGQFSEDLFLINADGSGTTRLFDNPPGNRSGMCPDWSPDGRKIAFRTDDIYVINSDGTGRVNLTNGRGKETCPFWSPDGSKIAFYAYYEANDFGYTDIYVMNADGSNQRNLTPSTIHATDLAWSPDGRQIAYTGIGPGDTEGIYVTSVEGNGERNISGGGGGPRWSPDGKQIAFMKGAIRGVEVYLMNADGSGQRNLSNSLEREEFALAWSPDGRKILFASDRELWTMNPDGTGRTRLHPDFFGIEVSVWWH